jgi:hypothetical protein
MNIALCTLFEGNYHYGVAVLVNSLFQKGFRGAIYVGYRGELPFWALQAKDNTSFNWQDSKFLAYDGIEIYFLPIITEYHLTNYKPDFMLQLIGCDC